MLRLLKSLSRSLELPTGLWLCPVGSFFSLSINLAAADQRGVLAEPAST